MPTTDNRNVPLPEATDATAPEQDSIKDETDMPEISSEVARRVHLLGKLIIPPSRP
jgi:hypothetical protein